MKSSFFREFLSKFSVFNRNVYKLLETIFLLFINNQNFTFMGRINYQNVLFNVRDVDTFEIIHADFTLYLYPLDEGKLRTIRCGSSLLSNIPVQDSFLSILFYNVDMVSQAGYDVGSLEGGYIEFEKVEIGEEIIAYMPWEVNLFLKKLA